MKKWISRVVVAAIILVAAGLYMDYNNITPFAGGRISGLRDGHMRTIQPSDDYLRPLFADAQVLQFNYHGTGIRMNMAYYQRDELILHTHVVDMVGWNGEQLHSGNIAWAATWQSHPLNNLYAYIMTVHGGGVRLFDFEDHGINFEAQAQHSGFPNGPIERGQHYVLRVWRTEGRHDFSDDPFDPAVLARSEHTAILYVVFD